MKKIPLTQGKYAIVDDEDYPYLSRLHWIYSNTGHAVLNMKTLQGSQTSILMCWLLITRKTSERVLYRNGDSLDNRKENLISVLPGNALQRNTKIPGTSSKYKGVSWAKHWNKWVANITYKGGVMRLGGFATEVEAAEAYNKKAFELYGEFASLNKID